MLCFGGWFVTKQKLTGALWVQMCENSSREYTKLQSCSVWHLLKHARYFQVFSMAIMPLYTPLALQVGSSYSTVPSILDNVRYFDFCRPGRYEMVPYWFFLKDFIYLLMRDTQREAETQAKRQADSLRGAQQSQDPGVMTRAEGRCSTTEPLRDPWGS